jgi:hypothetical protein
VSLVEQELLILPKHLRSSPVFSGIRVTRSLGLYVCFVDRCLSGANQQSYKCEFKIKIQKPQRLEPHRLPLETKWEHVDRAGIPLTSLTQPQLPEFPTSFAVFVFVKYVFENDVKIYVLHLNIPYLVSMMLFVLSWPWSCVSWIYK